MKHGADIYRYASLFQCKEEKIIDFSSNINAYHPKSTLNIKNEMLVRYAEPSYKALKKEISKKYHIKKSQISLHNGASSAIFFLLSFLKERSVYLYAPLYGEYEKACSGKDIIKINRFSNLYEKPEKNSIIVFVNPSTPEAKYYDLKKLFILWKEQNCTIILDESFLEFEDLPSYRDEINHNKNLYIIQSFSKFYSCAGIRIGAIFSHKINIQQLKTPLWNLSSYDVEFLKQRLQDKSFTKKSKKLHYKNKENLLKILKKSNLFEKIYPSDSNFYLCKSSKADKIFAMLLRKKILTRTCGSFDYLSNDYLRFAVKDKKAHSLLKEVLNAIT